MRNIMKCLVLFTAISIGVSAQAAYTIYWKIDNDNVTVDGEAADYSYAAVGVSGNPGVYLTDAGYIQTDGEYVTGYVLKEDAGNEQSASSQLSATQGFDETASFFLALFDESDHLFAVSETKSYADLTKMDALYNGDNPDGRGLGATWTGSAFASVPEPTSGLLFLLGFAALSLRRKSKK